MTYKEEILREFGEWIKTQPIYVGGGLTDREILVIRDGEFESAIEVYLKENIKTDCLDEDAKQASIPYTYNAPKVDSHAEYWNNIGSVNMRKGEEG